MNTTQLHAELIDITEVEPKLRVATFKKQKEQQVRLRDLGIGYQSRRPQVESLKNQQRDTIESKEHSARMLQSLEAGEPLDPVLVTEVEGKLRLIDGYHRLAAYRQYGADTITAHVVRADAKTSTLLSYECNLKSEHKSVSQEQQMQQRWEVVREAFDPNQGPRGHWSPPKEEIKRMFGLRGSGSLDNMRQAVVRLGEDAKHIDWKDTKGKREWAELSDAERAEGDLKVLESILNEHPDPQRLANIAFAIQLHLQGQDYTIDDFIENRGMEARKVVPIDEEF